jgi:hypothetical protein
MKRRYGVMFLGDPIRYEILLPDGFDPLSIGRERAFWFAATAGSSGRDIRVDLAQAYLIEFNPPLEPSASLDRVEIVP